MLERRGSVVEYGDVGVVCLFSGLLLPFSISLTARIQVGGGGGAWWGELVSILVFYAQSAIAGKGGVDKPTGLQT